MNEEGLSENVTVGNAFTIGDEKFEDLDELIDEVKAIKLPAKRKRSSVQDALDAVV